MAAWASTGKYLTATVKSRFMPPSPQARRSAAWAGGGPELASGHVINQLLAELLDAEELLREPVERAVSASLADGLIDDGLEIGRALLERDADIAHLEGLAGKGRLARKLLEIVAGGEIGRDDHVDAPGAHVGEHLGVTGIALERLEGAELLLDLPRRDLAVVAA